MGFGIPWGMFAFFLGMLAATTFATVMVAVHARPSPALPGMLAAASPLRLAVWRMISAATLLAAVGVAVSLYVGDGGLDPGIAGFLVFAAHAGLSVGASSWFERQATRGGSVAACSVLAGLSGVAILFVGQLQATYAVATLRGGPEAAAQELNTMGQLYRSEPEMMVSFAVLGLLYLGIMWGAPSAAMVTAQLRRPRFLFLGVCLPSFCLALPGVLLLVSSYWLGRKVYAWTGGEWLRTGDEAPAA